MSHTTTKAIEAHSSTKTYSHREHANKAIEAFQALASHLDEKQAKDAYIHLCVARGFSQSQPLYYDKTSQVPTNNRPYSVDSVTLPPASSTSVSF
jgi:hypothetical protein